MKYSTNEKPKLIYELDDEFLDNFEKNIPEEMFKSKNFLGWRFEHKEERWTKAPRRLDYHDRYASPTDSSHWVTGNNVLHMLELAWDDVDGINFAVSEDSPIFAIDLDDCRETETGEISEWAWKHIRGFDSYTEISPSGEGIRIFAKCRERPFCVRTQAVKGGGKIEYFGDKHTASLTVMPLEGYASLREISSEKLASWCRKTFDKSKAIEKLEEQSLEERPDIETLWSKIMQSKKAAEIQSLLSGTEDESEGEAKLVGHLKFWCSNDADLIEAIIRRYATYREKWDSPRKNGTYLSYTIQNLVAQSPSQEVYNPSTLSVAPPVTEALEAAVVAQEIAKPKLLKSLADLKALPPMTWLVENLLPANSLSILYGEPGSGKSFVALDMACSIASGESFHTHDVHAGAVVYVAAEGAWGLTKRIAAWESAHPDADLSKLHFVTNELQLAGADLDSLLADIATLEESPALVVIDTLSRCNVGRDENSAKDMSTFIAACDRIRATGAAVMLLHHTSKAGETERGSTVLRGAADCMYRVDPKRSDLEQLTGLKLVCSKQKDAAPAAAMHFTLEADSDSVYLELTDSSNFKPAMGQRDTAILESLPDVGSIKFAQIAQQTGIAESSLRRMLTALEARGLVAKTGWGEYRRVKDAQVPLLEHETDPYS